MYAEGPISVRGRSVLLYAEGPAILVLIKHHLWVIVSHPATRDCTRKVHAYVNTCLRMHVNT